MAKTKTERLIDYTVENQIKFVRLANRKVREFEAMLRSNTLELKGFVSTLEYPVRRRAFEKTVSEILMKHKAEVTEALTNLRQEVALLAASYEVTGLSIMNQALTIPKDADIFDALTTQMFQGATMEEWINEYTRADHDRVLRGIRTEMTYGASGSKLSNLVHNGKKAGFRAQTFRALGHITRSAVLHALSAGRDSVWQLNRKLMQRLLWVSVLDSNTSDTCRFLDGKTYSPTKGPRPPAHLNCRSTMVPLLKGDKLPRKQSWFDWIETQPQAVQLEALGPTRYRLWKEGGAKPIKFLNDEGEQYTLAELKARMPAAFRRLQDVR